MAYGAACGGFLLLLLVLGPRVQAGTSLTLSAAVLGALLAAAAVVLAELHWASAAALALVPVLVRLPLPATPLWMKPVLACVYALVAAGGACALAWIAPRGWTF
jgi:hypothetical protein